jgi:hypothetical protein
LPAYASKNSTLLDQRLCVYQVSPHKDHNTFLRLKIRGFVCFKFHRINIIIPSWD